MRRKNWIDMKKKICASSSCLGFYRACAGEKVLLRFNSEYISFWMAQTPSPDKDKGSPIPRQDGGGGFAGSCLQRKSTGRSFPAGAHRYWEQGEDVCGNKSQYKSPLYLKPSEVGCDTWTSGLQKVSHNKILSQITPFLLYFSFSGTHCIFWVSDEFVTV